MLTLVLHYGAEDVQWFMRQGCSLLDNGAKSSTESRYQGWREYWNIKIKVLLL